MIRVEFYDLARVRAGAAHVDVEGGTLRDVLRAAAAACPGLAGEVVRDGVLDRHWRASRNGATFVDDPDTPLDDGDALVLLSATAGG